MGRVIRTVTITRQKAMRISLLTVYYFLCPYSLIEAVCSHVPHGDYDEDKVWKTISSSVYDLNGKTAYICKGCPCEGTYISYKV